MLAVVDGRSGRVYGPWLQYMVAFAFKRDSRLLMVDPLDSVLVIFGKDVVDDRCAVCGTPGAYLWDEDHFEPLITGPHELARTR